MSLFARYIGGLYLKYLFVLFVSLECFFVAIDLVKYLDELPNSANLVVLLVFYDFIYILLQIYSYFTSNKYNPFGGSVFPAFSLFPSFIMFSI